MSRPKNKKQFGAVHGLKVVFRRFLPHFLKEMNR